MYIVFMLLVLSRVFLPPIPLPSFPFLLADYDSLTSIRTLGIRLTA